MLSIFTDYFYRFYLLRLLELQSKLEIDKNQIKLQFEFGLNKKDFTTSIGMKQNLFKTGDVVAFQIFKSFFSSIWSVLICTGETIDPLPKSDIRPEDKQDSMYNGEKVSPLADKSADLHYKLLALDVFSKQIQDYKFDPQLLVDENRKKDCNTPHIHIRKYLLNSQFVGKFVMSKKIKNIGHLSEDQLKSISRFHQTYKSNYTTIDWNGLIAEIGKVYNLSQSKLDESKSIEKKNVKKQKRKEPKINNQKINEKDDFQEFARAIKLKTISAKDDLVAHIVMLSPTSTIETIAKLSGSLPEETKSGILETFKSLGAFRTHLETKLQKFVLFQNALLIKFDGSCKIVWYKDLVGLQVEIVENTIYDISVDTSHGIILHGRDGKIENISFVSSKVERFMLDSLENDIYTHIETQIITDFKNGKDIDFGHIVVNDNGFYDAHVNLIKWSLISLFSKIDVNLTHSNFDLIYINNKKINKFNIDTSKVINYKVFMRILGEKINS